MSAEELRICFAGSVEFVIDGNVVLALQDVPLLGVTLDLANALRELHRGADHAAFLDFYGEFELSFSRKDGDIQCENTFTGQSFSVPSTDLFGAVSQWASSLSGLLDQQVTSVASNPHYQGVIDELRTLAV